MPTSDRSCALVTSLKKTRINAVNPSRTYATTEMYANLILASNAKLKGEIGNAPVIACTYYAVLDASDVADNLVATFTVDGGFPGSIDLCIADDGVA